MCIGFVWVKVFYFLLFLPNLTKILTKQYRIIIWGWINKIEEFHILEEKKAWLLNSRRLFKIFVGVDFPVD